MKLYFAYGANLNLSSMARRCPDAQPIREFYLRDWCLEFAGHANIRPEPGSLVPGALWEITESCEASLDRFEGYPVYYDKQTFALDGEEVMFYVMQDPRPAVPQDGYLLTIARGYSDWNLDHYYLWQALDSTQEEQDDMYWNSTTYFRSTPELDHGQSGLDLGHDPSHLRDMAYTDPFR